MQGFGTGASGEKEIAQRNGRYERYVSVLLSNRKVMSNYLFRQDKGLCKSSSYFQIRTGERKRGSCNQGTVCCCLCIMFFINILLIGWKAVGAGEDARLEEEL